MVKRFRSALLALIATAALITGAAIVAPTAQAVTWANLGLITDTTYVDDCSGTAGAVRVELEWQVSSDYKLRLRASRDLKIVNNSDAWLLIRGEDFDDGNGHVASVSYIRLKPSTPSQAVISNYTNSFWVNPHSTSTLSVDNPARWARMDGVSDSDPSPSGTAISTNSDPAIEMNADVYGPGGVCGWGGFRTEIKNNAA